MERKLMVDIDQSIKRAEEARAMVSGIYRGSVATRMSDEVRVAALISRKEDPNAPNSEIFEHLPTNLGEVATDILKRMLGRNETNSD